jgi:hypothetical protein
LEGEHYTRGATNPRKSAFPRAVPLNKMTIVKITPAHSQYTAFPREK